MYSYRLVVPANPQQPLIIYDPDSPAADAWGSVALQGPRFDLIGPHYCFGNKERAKQYARKRTTARPVFVQREQDGAIMYKVG